MSENDDNEQEVKALFDRVKDEYGDRLTEEQVEKVKEGVEGIVTAAHSLRAVKLGNGDEPFSVFVPFRKEG